ncbi:class A beta-lactamase-related serine hydrolase [Pontibacter diazotrophicus]|uniref:Class A beta-lactamase-related serine hydrolase n=1 Tax=Pontibacter diazotrophicus TaxID=1400979 RepID=A0A3D8L5C3_9BACT|nr:serine hydrolase domain-containing protein [Pontibacter diazotrophicus]RDV12625.1 class A beta-lactamase-related serine hydrolase [Pontibacter diazotrophicus]
MTTRRKALFLFLCLISCLSNSKALCQEVPTPQTLEELKSLLESEMKRQHVAGMMLTIATRDSTIYTGGLGYADVDKKVPVTDRHLFRQASITKLFTALGVLSLVDEDKLELDSRLRDIAPEIPFQNEWEEANPVTIAQLMEHSTGFSDKSPMEEFNFEREEIKGLKGLEVLQDHMESRWKPGERHSYSGVNYAILAYVIEKVSSESFQDYMRGKVFSRLGMPDANVSLTDEGSGTYSKGYIWNGSRFQLVPHQPQYNPGYGSLNASAMDFAHALQAYLHDWQTPKEQFLSKEMLHDSETPHTYLSAQAGLHNTYAFGNESREIGGTVFRGHSGSIAGYLSNFLYNRELGLGFAFSVNTFNPGFHRYATDLIARFLTQHLDTPTDPPVYPLQVSEVKPFLGYYRLSSGSDRYMGYFQSLQSTFKLERHQDVLNANFLLGGSMNWKAADSRRLLFTNEWAKDPRIMLLRDGENQPAIVEDTMYFERISAVEAWAPIALLFLCLLIMASSIVFGLVSATRLLLIRKKSLNAYLLRLSPALATLGLLLGIWAISQFIHHITTGVPISDITIMWTTGRYLFAFFTLGSAILLVLRWKSLQSRWLRVYMAAVALCGCYLFTVLVISNWY